MKSVFVVMILAVVLAGCSLLSGDDSKDPDVARSSGDLDPVTQEPATATPLDTPDTPEPADPDDGSDTGFPTNAELREMGAVATCDALGDEYCQDSDGNIWPDFVEEAVGRDPLTDECAQTGCLGTSVDDFLAQVQSNTLFILDSSGSMAGDAGGGLTKIQAARQALIGYVAATPDFVDIGLMVYGHQGDNSDAGRPESCVGIETFAPIGDLTVDSVEAVVGQFEATGWTPIGASLDAAGPVVQAAQEADLAEGIDGATNRIVLISDGIETCDGDPVASARGLADLGINVVVDVIGFDLAESDRASLQEVATVTGGTYSDARTGADLMNVLGEYDAQIQRTADAMDCQFFAFNSLNNCSAELGAEAQDYLQTVSEDLREQGDDDRANFLLSWRVQVAEDEEDMRDVVLREMEDQWDSFVEQYDEASRRQEEFLDRVGATQKVAAQPFYCPFKDRDLTV
ncbi:MAG: VWA domain-containing protein [Euzebya sp.]